MMMDDKANRQGMQGGVLDKEPGNRRVRTRTVLRQGIKEGRLGVERVEGGLPWRQSGIHLLQLRGHACQSRAAAFCTTAPS